MFKVDKALGRFKDFGYVVLDFVEPEALEELYKLYKETEPLVELEANFYTSIWSENTAYKNKINNELKSILGPFLDEHLQNYKVAFSNFMVKKSGYSSSLQPHQDWTFVQEPDNYSITVWVPLMDVTEENGALEILPGSNKLDNYVRARFMDSPFSDHNKYIEENLMKSIPLKKGQALLVNSRTIHASPDNLSDFDRIAASIVVYPESASLLHYVMDDAQENLVNQLAIDSSFFVKYSCFERPLDEKVLRELSFQEKLISLEKLDNL
jgi:hypothetical protein